MKFGHADNPIFSAGKPSAYTQNLATAEMWNRAVGVATGSAETDAYLDQKLRLPVEAVSKKYCVRHSGVRGSGSLKLRPRASLYPAQ